MSYLSQKFKTNLFIKYFGFTKVPLIFYCKPKVVDISSDSVTLKIPLLRRNRNHVGSMYIGALAIGADLSSAILALNLVDLKALGIFVQKFGMQRGLLMDIQKKETLLLKRMIMINGYMKNFLSQQIKSTKIFKITD